MLINLDKAVGKIVSFLCLNMLSYEFMRSIQENTYMEIITNVSPNEIIYYRDKLYEQFLFYFIYFLTLSFYIEGLRRSQT